MTENKYATVIKDTVNCTGKEGKFEKAISVPFGIIDTGDTNGTKNDRYKIYVACSEKIGEHCGADDDRCYIEDEMYTLRDKL